MITKLHETRIKTLCLLIAVYWRRRSGWWVLNILRSCVDQSYYDAVCRWGSGRREGFDSAGHWPRRSQLLVYRRRGRHTKEHDFMRARGGLLYPGQGIAGQWRQEPDSTTWSAKWNRDLNIPSFTRDSVQSMWNFTKAIYHFVKENQVHAIFKVDVIFMPKGIQFIWIITRSFSTN